MVIRARLFLAVVLALLAVGFGMAPASQAAPPNGLAQIDQAIEQRWATVVAWQENYRATHGVYFQGLHSHRGSVPRSNQNIAPTGLDDRPTDRPHALRDFWNGGGMPASTPFAIVVDVYSGPQGDGWTITISTVDGGATWRRTLHNGPETWRAQPWAMVQP